TALLEQSLSSLPEEVRRLEQLELRLREAEQRRRTLEAEWKAAQLQFQAAKERSIQAEAKRGHALTQKQEAEANANAARDGFLEALRKAGFASAESYQSAKLKAEERDALKGVLERYRTDLAAAAKRIQELTAILSNRERHDLSVLERRLQEREAAIEALRKQYMHEEHLLASGTELKADIVAAEESCR